MQTAGGAPQWGIRMEGGPRFGQHLGKFQFVFCLHVYLGHTNSRGRRRVGLRNGSELSAMR